MDKQIANRLGNNYFLFTNILPQNFSKKAESCFRRQMVPFADECNHSKPERVVSITVSVAFVMVRHPLEIAGISEIV